MSARRQASTTSLAKYARAHSPILQNRSLDFCNSFWGFGDGGVDVLFARMRGATRTMEELKNFWRERAVIEEDYAKRLAKLSKMTLGRDEIGDLRVSLDTVRSEIERQAGFHLNLSQQIRTELEVPTATFHSRQLQHKKTYQTGIEKEFKTKQTQESYVNKAREKYEQDCVRINAFTAQATLVQGKDLEKINLKLERTQQTVQTNEREFANFAKALQDTVQKWETDWKGFCDSCQDMEEDRMEFMKDNVWSYANAVSTVCVADDESCEKIRLALEQMEPEKDMESFVREYGTGNQIPDPPAFVNYQEPDAIPSSSARPTSRPASFARSTHRELPIRQHSLPPEEEPVVNAAGIGAGGGGGGRRVDPYIQDAPGPSRSDTRNSQVSQPPYTNGTNGYYPHPGAGSSPSSASSPLSQQQVHRQSTTSTQYSQQQQLQRVLQDPHADPIDPTAETYIKVGANAYKVDLTKDPQQQGPSNVRHSTSSPASPAKPVGGGVDPLMRQLEELQHAVSASGSVRRNTLIKPKQSTGPEPKPGHVSSMSASSRIESSSRPTSLSPPVAPGSAASHRRSPSPNRDYRNSAEAVVGVHPSVSRPPSPNPPTAAFMVPKPSTPSGPGADVVQEVLADYQQSLPGERKSISRSPSRGHAPSQSQVSVLTHQSNQSQGQNLARPPSQVGHAGIGAFGSRSNSPQPLSRGPSPAPSASQQQQQQQQQQARSNFIQPPAQAGPGLVRAPSPNTVGIALDPSGRVLHDEMAQRYQQQQQQQHHQPPPQQVQQQRPAPPPQTAQPTYQPPPPPAQAIQQQQQQQARRASYVTQASTIAPPLAPQTYAVTPPPSNVYQTPSPQPQSYLPPQQQVQPVYSAPPPQPLQYQPPSQQQSQQQARYLQQQQQQVQQQQQLPPSPYSSVNGLQRGGSTISYYGNQTPPQQQQMQAQPQQLLQQPVQQQRLGQGQVQQQQQRGYQQPQYRDPSPVRATPSPQPPPQTVDDGSTVLFYVKALYDYTATIEEEFDFQAGDIIAVTATPEDGWWSGELLDEARRQKGRNVFPSNFVCLF